MDPPGQAKTDQEILARIFLAVRDLYRKEGGALPEAVLNIAGITPIRPTRTSARSLKRLTARLSRTSSSPPARRQGAEEALKAAGQQLDSFGQLRADGSTSCGNWLYTGVLHRGRQQHPASQHGRPERPGDVPPVGFSWPANRRVMYNRASADRGRKAVGPARPGIQWNGEKWVGDVPDIAPDSPPGKFGAVHHAARGLRTSLRCRSSRTARLPSTTRRSKRRSPIPFTPR